MKALLLSVTVCSLMLSGCASVWTSTDFTPYVGDETVYIGRGGAMEVMGGIEVWKQGLPHKPYKIIGLVTGDIMDGWGAEDWMTEASAIEAKEHGADAIIKQSVQSQQGTPYVNIQKNNTTVNQTNVANVYNQDGAVTVAQGNAAVFNANPGGFAGGFAQGMNSSMGVLVAAGRVKGSFLAIKYVTE